MRTIWQSLAWKEWHEHKWKLAALTAILLCCIAVAFKSQNSQHFSLFAVAILLPMIPLSLVIATTSATSERSRGTLPFLLALPTSPKQIAKAKLLSGLGTCLLPVLFVLGLIYVWYMCWDWFGLDYQMPNSNQGMLGPFGFSNWYLATITVVAIWVLSMFLWTAASGVNRADEVSAAAVALSVIAGLWIAVAGVVAWSDLLPWARSDRLAAQLAALGLAILPGGFAQAQWLPEMGISTYLMACTLFVAVHGGLATWFIARFGRSPEQNIRSQRTAVPTSPQLSWLGQPRRSWLTAIAWKQFRESGPLVFAGLGGVALILVGALFVARKEVDTNVEMTVFLAAAIFFGSLYLGGFTILVVGIGIFLRDLTPGIHTFWRSRPISPRGWYWVKYATGALIVVLSFQLPMLVLPLITSLNSEMANEFNGTPDVVGIQVISLFAYLAVFAVAIAMTCLMRSAVYAVVLTFAMFYGGAISTLR